MPTVIFVDQLGRTQTVLAPEGGSFIKLCDAADSPVPFHCRCGNCGTCRIAVIEGADELLPAQRQERHVLDVLGLSPPDHRLACQAQMHSGQENLRVKPLGKRTPAPRALWVPVAHDAETNEIRACPSDRSMGDILISGTAELKVGSVILLTFRAPVEPASGSIVGRILRVAPPGANPGRYMTAIELLEPDETLESLFEPVGTPRPP